MEKLQNTPVMQDRAKAVHTLLQTIPKEDAVRAGLIETPWRVAKMYDELFSGYRQDAHAILADAVFDDIPSDDIVLLQDIQFYSTCEHHMMPFFGKVHIAYIPQQGRVVGISKLARIVEVYARRLQVQERLGKQISECIQKALGASGVMVIIEAEHTCMTARGIQKPGTLTKTSTVSGLFALNPGAKNEVYQLLNK